MRAVSSYTGASVLNCWCRLCAADNKCSAYNWADGTAEEFPNQVFLCHKLHDVHPGVAGWELGIRAGRGYDSPYKKRAAVLTMEI